MAKRRSFPTKACPKCGKPIHARLQRHEACGWVMNASLAAPASAAPATPVKRGGRPKKARAGSAEITVADIQAVKSLVEKLGGDKVRQLAEVLAK